jgi:hypothetical protein
LEPQVDGTTTGVVWWEVLLMALEHLAKKVLSAAFEPL